MLLDIQIAEAPSGLLADARGPPFLFASCASYPPKPDFISSKFGHGGARENSGGARENSGGARLGAGRPRVPPPGLARPIDGFRWYVVRTMHGQTEVADAQIREAGFDVLTALECHPRVAARRSAAGSYIRAREEWFGPLFSRYIIVSLNLADPHWRLIPGMPSVERIISGGHLANNGVGVPIAIAEAGVERLRKVLSPTGILYPPGYRAPVDDEDPIRPGVALHPSEGTLADRAAICAMSDGKRVIMLMSMFNRDNVRVHAAQASVSVTSGGIVAD